MQNNMVDPIEIMVKAFEDSNGETVDLVVEHELPGVTMEMLNWFFQNVSKYYKLWYFEDHISEERIDDPKQGQGASRIRIAREKFGDLPFCDLRLRHEEPGDSPFTYLYNQDIKWSSILSPDDKPIGCITHESKSESSGIRMRSVFRFPAKTPQWLIDAVHKHNREEMGRLPVFLPDLYKQNVS